MGQDDLDVSAGNPEDRKSAGSGGGSPSGASTSGTESISQLEVANRLALSDKQIRNLTKNHVISRNPDKTYPWPQVQKEYIRFKQEEKERRNAPPEGGAGLNLMDEQAKLTAVKREIAELDLAQRRGELIDIQAMEEMLRAPLEQIDAALKNAPSRYASDLAQAAGIKTPAAMKMLGQIVERIRADIRLIRHVDDSTAAA